MSSIDFETMPSIAFSLLVVAVAVFIMAIATLDAAIAVLKSIKERPIYEGEEAEAEDAEAEAEDAEAEAEDAEVEAEDAEVEADDAEVEADDAEVEAEVQEEVYRIAVPSGNEMALKKKGPHISIGLVESGTGQIFRVIPLTNGTFAGAIKIQAVGGFADGKVLDNYKQKNDHLCLYKTSRDNNRAQNWKKVGNKLISMTTGKLQLKVNGDSIGFSNNGDDIIFIPA